VDESPLNPRSSFSLWEGDAGEAPDSESVPVSKDASAPSEPDPPPDPVADNSDQALPGVSSTGPKAKSKARARRYGSGTSVQDKPQQLRTPTAPVSDSSRQSVLTGRTTRAQMLAQASKADAQIDVASKLSLGETISEEDEEEPAAAVESVVDVLAQGDAAAVALEMPGGNPDDIDHVAIEADDPHREDINQLLRVRELARARNTKPEFLGPNIQALSENNARLAASTVEGAKRLQCLIESLGASPFDEQTIDKLEGSERDKDHLLSSLRTMISDRVNWKFERCRMDEPEAPPVNYVSVGYEEMKAKLNLEMD